MQLNEKISYYRKKAMLSQEALAEKLGVSRQAVSKWETGESQPELGNLAALASALNVSVDWLLSPDEPVEEPQPQPSPQPAQSGKYPDWLDKLPGFLQRFLYRYGWLAGVRLAVSGALFVGLGALARFAVSVMTASFRDATQSMFGGFQDSVNGIPITSFDGVTSGFYDAMTSMLTFNPVNIVANAIIVLGAVLLIGGVVLAVVLKKYGEGKE